MRNQWCLVVALLLCLWLSAIHNIVHNIILNRFFLLALQLAQIHFHLANLPLVIFNCLLQVLALIVTIPVVFIVILILLMTIAPVSISLRGKNEGRGRESGPHWKSDRFTFEVILIDLVHRMLIISSVAMIISLLDMLFYIGMQWNFL